MADPAMADSAQLYLRFADIFNTRQYDRLQEVMVDDFVDHHPGLVDVDNLADYRKNLAGVIEALEMAAVPEEVLAAGDKVFTRIKLTGRHTGVFLGVQPTGAEVTWYTNELWRVVDGRFVERWAVDDLLSLLLQIGVELPTWSD